MLVNLMYAIGEIVIAGIIAWWFIAQLAAWGFGGLVVSGMLIIMVIVYALVSIANAIS